METLTNIIHNTVDKYKDKLAVSYMENKVECKKTYREFNEDLEVVIASLHRLFNKRKVHIGIMGKNSYEWVVSFFAIICGGYVLVPIDVDMSGNGLANIVEQTDMKVVLCDRKIMDKFGARRFSRDVQLKEMKELFVERVIDNSIMGRMADTGFNRGCKYFCVQ